MTPCTDRCPAVVNAAAEVTASVEPSVCAVPVAVVAVVEVTSAPSSGVPVHPVTPVNEVPVLAV